MQINASFIVIDTRYLHTGSQQMVLDRCFIGGLKWLLKWTPLFYESVYTSLFVQVTQVGLDWIKGSLLIMYKCFNLVRLIISIELRSYNNLYKNCYADAVQHRTYIAYFCFDPLMIFLSYIEIRSLWQHVISSFFFLLKKKITNEPPAKINILDFSL